MFITTGPTSPIDPAERAAMMSAEAEDLNELFDRDNDSQADTQQAPPRGGSHTHTRAHTHARAHTRTRKHLEAIRSKCTLIVTVAKNEGGGKSQKPSA